MAKVLLKDIIIPKGTVFNEAPKVTERIGNDFFSCTIALSPNTFGSLVYGVDSDYLEELDNYFTDLK